MGDPTRRRDPDTHTRNLRIIAGEWRIARRLGRGGTANVYLALHIHDDRRAALKILRRDLVGQKTLVRRFIREAELTAKIRHPGVIEIHGHGTTQDGRPYIVTELLEGETLDERRMGAPRKRLDWQDVVSVGVRVLDALQAAHDAGVVHRDVKPTNVFVTTAGDVKLLDFGIAGSGEDASVLTTDDTRTALGIGTPLFMAPEQLTGDDAIDGRADLFGVAATLFHAMSGRVPFGTSKFTAGALIAAYSGGPADLRELVPTVPRQIVRVLNRALAMRTRDRFASANDMKLALTTAAEAALDPPRPATKAHVWLDQTAPLPTVRRMSVPTPRIAIPSQPAASSVAPASSPSGEVTVATGHVSSNPAIAAPAPRQVSAPSYPPSGQRPPPSTPPPVSPVTPRGMLASGVGPDLGVVGGPPRPASTRPHPGPPPSTAPPSVSSSGFLAPVPSRTSPLTVVLLLVIALLLVVVAVLAMRIR